MQSTEQQGGRDCCDKLKRDYNSLLREKGECMRLLEDLMRENELKKKECHQAQTSMHELQMELRRKSMHVDSIASAVVGRVEERSRWRQLLEDLSEKFEALKTEHQALKTDATQMMNQYASLEFKDLKERFSEEPKERKDLYNKHIDLKGFFRRRHGDRRPGQDHAGTKRNGQDPSVNWQGADSHCHEHGKLNKDYPS